jgi:DNA-binding response OmpR family regulator
MNGNIRALLVEDNDGDAFLLEEIISEKKESSHIELTRAESVSQGISQLSQNKFDVVLLDLGLPDANGVTSIKKIKEHANEAPIIIITGSTLKRDELRDCISSTDEFCIKGFLDSESLTYTIESAIRNHKIENK